MYHKIYSILINLLVLVAGWISHWIPFSCDESTRSLCIRFGLLPYLY